MALLHQCDVVSKFSQLSFELVDTGTLLVSFILEPLLRHALMFNELL